MLNLGSGDVSKAGGRRLSAWRRVRDVVLRGVSAARLGRLLSTKGKNAVLHFAGGRRRGSDARRGIDIREHRLVLQQTGNDGELECVPFV